MTRHEKQKWRLRWTKKISNYWKSQRTNWSRWIVPKSSLGIWCLFALLPKFEICAETRLQLFETFIPWLFEKVFFFDTSCPEILIRVSTGILVGKACINVWFIKIRTTHKSIFIIIHRVKRIYWSIYPFYGYPVL